MNVYTPTGFNFFGSAVEPGGGWPTTATFVSLSTNCESNSNNPCDVTTTPAGSLTGFTFTFSAAVPTNSSYTITLLQSASQGGTQTQVGSTCAVGAGAAACNISFSVPVAQGTFIQMQVVKTGTGAVETGTATAVASELASSGLLTTPPPFIVIGNVNFATANGGIASATAQVSFPVPFSSAATYFCTVTNASSTARTLFVTNNTAQTITITASAASSDTVNFHCIGN
jgi:hypothetical protein